MPSQSPRRLSAHQSRLVEDWGRFGNSGELQRICRDILTRQRQGYPVAFEAWHIIRSHADHWRLDAPVELEGSRKNRVLLKTGAKVVRRLDRALRDMIDLHRQSEKRRWYGKKIVAGEMQRRRDGSWVKSRHPWTRFPQLYEQTLKALDTDPLWQTLRETPPDMWLIPPRGKVAYFLAEHSAYTLQSLYHKTQLPHEGELWIVGPDAMKPSKAIVRSGAVDQDAVNRLVKWSEGADLIVFDPLSAFVQGANAEQDNAIMRLVLDQMQLIAQTNNAACLILAHEGKPQVDRGRETKRQTYKIRGASSIEDALTHVFYFDRGRSENSYVLDTTRKFKGTPLVGQIHLSRDAETLQHRMLNAPPMTAKQNRLVKFKTEIASLNREYPDLNTTKKVPLAAERTGVSESVGWEYWKEVKHSGTLDNTYIEASRVPELE